MATMHLGPVAKYRGLVLLFQTTVPFYILYINGPREAKLSLSVFSKWIVLGTSVVSLVCSWIGRRRKTVDLNLACSGLLNDFRVVAVG